MQAEMNDGSRRFAQEFEEARMRQLLARQDVRNVVVGQVPDKGEVVEVNGLAYTVTRRRMDDNRIALALEIVR